MNRMVVKVATTSTTNMTGLRIITRGLSFQNASPSAGHRMAGSSTVVADLRLRVVSIPGDTVASMF